MSEVNKNRNGCKDVYRAFLVQNAMYEGIWEIPCIKAEQSIPDKLIPFSKAMRTNDPNAWIHFYEDDVLFERVWNAPQRYLPILARYKGIITPDFSLYRDMPLVMQYWNIYRSHAIGSWLQENGIPVIANVRFADERTYEICCTGVPKNSTIAIGSHGCVKLKQEREYFQRGLEFVVNKIQPRTIVVYGSAQDLIFEPYKNAGIEIRHFDSNTYKAHRKAVA